MDKCFYLSHNRCIRTESELRGILLLRFYWTTFLDKCFTENTYCFDVVPTAIVYLQLVLLEFSDVHIVISVSQHTLSFAFG